METVGEEAVSAITLAPPPRREAEPRREKTRREAGPARGRNASGPREPQPPQVPAAVAADQRPAAATRGRRDDHEDRPVLGMGDHVPMFMQRPVRAKPREEAES